MFRNSLAVLLLSTASIGAFAAPARVVPDQPSAFDTVNLRLDEDSCTFSPETVNVSATGNVIRVSHRRNACLVAGEPRVADIKLGSLPAGNWRVEVVTGDDVNNPEARVDFTVSTRKDIVMADHSIKGKTVLITGGAKNLGGLLARDFARQGAKAVAIHYNSASSKSDAEATVAAVKAAGAQAVAIQADLTTAGAVAKLFTDAVAAVGRPDIAINTVGKVLKKPFSDVSEAEYDEMTAVNSKTAFFFLKEAGKHANDNGKVLTPVTSLLGAFTPFYSSYAGTKAPVEHYTRAAAKEFGARGISVNAVGPGPMETPFFYGQETAGAQAYHKTAAALSPYSDTGLTDIEDVVPFIRHLVSDGWWVTGQTIPINGGYTTK